MVIISFILVMLVFDSGVIICEDQMLVTFGPPRVINSNYDSNLKIFASTKLK